MKEELRYNWLDVFKAPRMALSLQKIWVLFPPLFVGYIVYSAFTFLGLAAAGKGEAGKAVLDEVWATHGLLPCVMGVPGVNIWSYVLWLIGVVALAACFLFGATAVARAAFLELKGETFFTYRELYGFAKKHAKDAILGPLGILAVIVGITVCGLVLGLFGRIPYVGIIPVVGLSPIWLGICFFLVALVIVFFFSLLLAPGITAGTKGDFFEVITETFSAAFSEPYRLVWYEAVLLFVGGLATWVLGWLVKLAYGAMVWILTLGMGDTFTAVAAKASAVTAQWFPAVAPKLGFLSGKAVPVAAGGLAAPAQWILGIGYLGPQGGALAQGYEAFWAYVLAVVAALAGFTVLACYGGAVLAAGNTLIYVVLHKIKDEEDLLELEEEEEEEEEEAKPGEEPKAEPAAEEKAESEEKKEGAEAPPEEQKAEAVQPEVEEKPAEEAEKKEAESQEEAPQKAEETPPLEPEPEKAEEAPESKESKGAEEAPAEAEEKEESETKPKKKRSRRKKKGEGAG